jgi:hypothetical protein
MRKKVRIGLICALIVILIIIVFLWINNSDNAIVLKANIIFGSGYCPKPTDGSYYEDKNHQRIASTAFTSYTCWLCHKKYDNATTAVPKICSSCATITGRCEDCGKLLKENTEDI